MYCICSIPSFSNKKDKKVNTHCLSYPPWPLFQDIHTHLHTRTLFVPIVKIQSTSILCGFHIYEFPYLLKLTIIPQNQYLGYFQLFMHMLKAAKKFESPNIHVPSCGLTRQCSAFVLWFSWYRRIFLHYILWPIFFFTFLCFSLMTSLFLNSPQAI